MSPEHTEEEAQIAAEEHEEAISWSRTQTLPHFRYVFFSGGHHIEVRDHGPPARLPF